MFPDEYAPAYVSALNLQTGPVRLTYVKPVSDMQAEAKKAEGAAGDSGGGVEIAERPVLSHGGIVDENIWRAELKSGRLLTFTDKSL